MNLADVKGLRFPDEYIIKFFFKTGLHRRKGNVLELGCGNGNNLSLFYQYGWNVVGVDIESEAVDNAFFNFSMLDVPNVSHRFLRHDISKGIKKIVTGKFDAILLPNVLMFIEQATAAQLMKELYSIADKGTYVFLRTRSLRDYRYGRGEKVGENTFRMTLEETGEKGLRYTFYHEYELVDMLRDMLHVDVSTMHVLYVDFQNLQEGAIVSNSDIVIWGQVLG